MTITIPAALVPLVRLGARFDLSERLSATAELLNGPGEWPNLRKGVDHGLARANATRALHDVLWGAAVDEPRGAVDVDLREHGDALRWALLMRIGVELDGAQDNEADAADRAKANIRAEKLAALVQRIEESEVISALAILGRAVREIREEQRLSVDELAQAADIPRRRLQAIEAGRHDPIYDVLLALGYALGRPTALLQRCEDLEDQPAEKT
jgi:DNA-binding XRE family transcriptional regulator